MVQIYIFCYDSKKGQPSQCFGTFYFVHILLNKLCKNSIVEIDLISNVLFTTQSRQFY